MLSIFLPFFTFYAVRPSTMWPKKNPLQVWREGMRISRSHFLGRDEEHAVVVLEILCATPKHPRIPRPLPHRPPPPPASDQVTLTQYSRHRRSSLLPLAPAPKRPCPTPQFGSLLTAQANQRRASQCAPPTAKAPIWVIAPYAGPPAATPDFGETFQFPALLQRLSKRIFTVFLNTTSQSGRTENPRTADYGT